MQRKWLLTAGVALVIVAATALAAFAARDGDSKSSSTAIPQATKAQLAAAKLGRLSLAPDSERVDLTVPRFSNPTRVTNPLFPISDLHSAILNGTVDGKPFKVETTLLPETRVVQWPEGQRTETLVSQYVAYSDGRIKEVALDFYAQADDGAVWYFGEDVFNYEDGAIADRDGTWLAGRNGPAAMIMPADPRVGDVYRPENIPGFVFEEVSVKTAGWTVAGPSGPAEGAIVAEELHQDGNREDKTFAPGYGEFFTAAGGDVEALALAVPTDELPGNAPAALEALLAGANRLFDRPRSTATLGEMTRAWGIFPAGGVPRRLEGPTAAALQRLADAVATGDRSKVRQAAVDMAQAGLDLQLRHRPPAEIDRARFELWARQLIVDSAAGDESSVRGDLATLEWIRDRFAHTLGKVDLVRVDTHLRELRTMLDDEDLGGAAAEATRLRETLTKRAR